MIIDIQNTETMQATAATDAKPAQVSKGSPEIRGKINLKKCSFYLDSPKMENGLDMHAGREFYDSNIPNDMIHPSIMEKTLSKKEFKEYRERYAMNDAKFIYDHSMDCKNTNPRSKGKQMDGFRFIISCKPEELSHCKTDKEKAEFLCMMTRTILQKMSASSDINFYYKTVPHLKDGNPHAHIMMSSYTIDGQYYPFFRGKQDHGLIKLFDDVKYDLEAKYPTLIQMEHEKREKNRLKIQIDKTTNEVSGEHAEIFNKLHKILMAHEGSNYSHPKILKQLREAGFEFRYTKAKSKTKFKDIQIYHKVAGESFRSYANLPFQAKRVIENFETYQYYNNSLKIKSDVSATVAKATLLVNSYPTKDVKELNKILYEELGVMLMPSFNKNHGLNRKWVSSWSFYLSRENVKFPAIKAGVLEPKKLIIEQKDAEELFEEVENIIKSVTTPQDVTGVRYSQRNRKEATPFRFLQNETIEEFLERMLEAKAYKQSLTSQIAFGNSIASGFNKRTMFETNGTDSLKIFQQNMASAKAAMQWYVAHEFVSIEFKGEENPEIQRNMYIQGILHNVKIDNYIPSAELKQEAQATLDAERDKIIASNITKIKSHIASVAADPDGEKQYIYLRANHKLDVDVDQRPKLHGFLYGIKMGLKPSDFKHMDKLTLSAEERKSVINHFASEEGLNVAQMHDLLIKAGLLSDEEPVHKEPQKPVQVSPIQGAETRPSTSTNGTTAPATTVSDTANDVDKKEEARPVNPPNPGKKGNDGLPKPKL